MKKGVVSVGLILILVMMFWFFSFKPIEYKEGSEFIIKILPGPTEKLISDPEDVQSIIERINNEKKSFSGINFESGGWVINIKYDHDNWFVSDSHIVIDNKQYSVSSNLLSDLKIIYMNLKY